jgi:hypothetical protein
MPRTKSGLLTFLTYTRTGILSNIVFSFYGLSFSDSQAAGAGRAGNPVCGQTQINLCQAPGYHRAELGPRRVSPATHPRSPLSAGEYVYVYVYVCVCMCMCMCMYVYVYVYVCMYVYVCVCVYVYVYVLLTPSTY